MLQVAKLHHLKILNLPHNCLSTIEGLKDLKLLTWLGLSGNRICTIDSLSQNIHLEHLDLSDNKITRISDISYLKNLKVFHSSIFLLDKTIDQNTKYRKMRIFWLLFCLRLGTVTPQELDWRTDVLRKVSTFNFSQHPDFERQSATGKTIGFL